MPTISMFYGILVIWRRMAKNLSASHHKNGVRSWEEWGQVLQYSIST